jgi:hypothetical protein
MMQSRNSARKQAISATSTYDKIHIKTQPIDFGQFCANSIVDVLVKSPHIGHQRRKKRFLPMSAGDTGDGHNEKI